jgi:DNA polymerase-3 subunit gamma/tau
MSQLIDTLRPKTWDSVIGQDDNVELLKSIIKTPDASPKVLIFEGVMGTGKTSCARIFAREINGMNEQEFKDKAHEFYYEQDSSTVYFKEDYLKNLLTNIRKNYWDVVFFDEIQSIRSTDQMTLLKPLEELQEKTFVILATTEINKILKPLRSRALELRFAAISYEAILAHLDFVEAKQGKPISLEIKQYIAYRARGHMRNAHMLIDKYYLMGDEAFMRNSVTAIDCLCDFFISAIEKNQNATKYLNTLVNMPLAELREDFDEFIIKCAQETIGTPSNNVNIERVAKAYGSKFKIVVDIYFQKWVSLMFESDIHFHLSMMNFYKAIKDSA